MKDSLLGLYTDKQIGYNELLRAKSNGWITDDDINDIMETPVTYTLDEAKSFKQKELSSTCSQRITSGIDVILEDNESHHFSLSENDQLNLQVKMLNITIGETNLEYHSDGNPCKYYSASDMTKICTEAQKKVTVETTRYNCLCQWIADCTTPEEVNSIEYDADIPEDYWSEPWRNIVSPTVSEDETEYVVDETETDDMDTVFETKEDENSQTE